MKKICVIMFVFLFILVILAGCTEAQSPEFVSNSPAPSNDRVPTYYYDSAHNISCYVRDVTMGTNSKGTSIFCIENVKNATLPAQWVIVK